MCPEVSAVAAPSSVVVAPDVPSVALDPSSTGGGGLASALGLGRGGGGITSGLSVAAGSAVVGAAALPAAAASSPSGRGGSSTGGASDQVRPPRFDEHVQLPLIKVAVLGAAGVGKTALVKVRQEETAARVLSLGNGPSIISWLPSSSSSSRGRGERLLRKCHA